MQQIGQEAGLDLDKRRFRANIYGDLQMAGFAENDLIGRRLQVGAKAMIAVIAPDPRCKMITRQIRRGGLFGWFPIRRKRRTLSDVDRRHRSSGDEINLLD
jgi:uncharacterized protein YcbX